MSEPSRWREPQNFSECVAGATVSEEARARDRGADYSAWI